MFLSGSRVCHITSTIWSVTLQPLGADHATIPHMKGDWYSFHMRYSSMICYKRLLSDRLHNFLTFLPLVPCSADSYSATTPSAWSGTSRDYSSPSRSSPRQWRTSSTCPSSFSAPSECASCSWVNRRCRLWATWDREPQSLEHRDLCSFTVPETELTYS